MPNAWGYYYSNIGTFQGYNSTAFSPCGELGPWNAFYCPANAGVYYHRPFLDEYSERTGLLGSAFIVAHEIGHHVSALLGWVPGYNLSTKQHELQADCFAGVWAQVADLAVGFTREELDGAARAIIRTGSPEHTWFNPTIHGTSTQRLTAFEAGFLSDGPFICDDPAWLGQFPLAEGETLPVPLGTGSKRPIN